MTVSDQIIAVLDDLCSKFGIAIDWTSENVIPYVKELLGKFITYEIVTSAIWIVLCLSIIVVAYTVRKKYYKRNEIKEIIGDDDGAFVLTMAFAISLVFIIPVVVQIFDIATCLTFPEKIIFDEVTYLMKTQ